MKRNKGSKKTSKRQIGSVCDMCGKKTEDLVKAKIEGTLMHVCRQCGRFGKVLGEVAVKIKEDFKTKRLQVPVSQTVEEELVEQVVSDFGLLIKKAREKLGMDHEEFAKYITEKESKISKMESGSFKPSLKIARKLERKLKIKLIEEVKEGNISLEGIKKTKGMDDHFTLGHFIKVKKKK
jgi:putative transcription factor